ncbi:hypothetical protein AB0J86_12630 [Micromonospora sp. NPDC049559]
MSDETPTPAPPPGRAAWISEDWAATVVGLVLLVLILTGVVSKGVLQ